MASGSDYYGRVIPLNPGGDDYRPVGLIPSFIRPRKQCCPQRHTMVATRQLTRAANIDASPGKVSYNQANQGACWDRRRETGCLSGHCPRVQTSRKKIAGAYQHDAEARTLQALEAWEALYSWHCITESSR